MNQVLDSSKMQPRVVSIYELLARLKPLMDGVPWAEDALMDLWKMGAPAPNVKLCEPGRCLLKEKRLHGCVKKWGCAMERRILLPTQFATWWTDVARRQGLEITPAQALKIVNRGMRPEMQIKMSERITKKA